MERIMSEEPTEHWGFLDFKDKVVLDLGCGKFYSSISTAQWFLDGGAKKVIGVDLGKEPIEDERLEALAMPINDKLGLEYLIRKWKPEVIKSDIEGAEIHFEDIEKGDMESVKQFAVEYHDGETKRVCEKMLSEWGFQNIKLYGLGNEDINRIGVYWAWK